jgi:hypothetical protein
MNDSFSEEQKFPKIWPALVSLTGIIIGVRIMMRRTMTYDELRNIGGVAMLSGVIVIGALLLLLFMKLKTRVDETGIYYKYTPLHREEIRIDWSNIKESYVRKYNPILDYGGWGIRMGIFGKGRAYNVWGNMGLQIILNNGKKLLLGTQKPEELKEVLSKLAEAGIANKSNNKDRF